ncbi:MAG: c-type cytochrome [Gammaproteobacteria bacterium]
MKQIPSLLLIAAGITSILSSPALAASSTDKQLIERGRYVVKVSGCNDCHTPAYIPNNGNIPVEQWLIGDNFGWNGPWGTTYGANLRLFMKDMTEQQWVETAKTLQRRPPMPWYNLNAMHEDDLRAIYHFVRSLGDAGKPAPAFVPVGQTPNPPYAIFPAPPQKLGQK